MVKFLRNPATGEASEHGTSCVAVTDYKGRRLIATGTTHGVLKIIDGASGQVAFYHKGHDAKIGACRFDVEGDELKVATVSADREAMIWNIRTGELFLTMQGHEGGVTCLAVRSVERRDLRMEGGRRLLATGSVDATCKLWSFASDNRCLRTFVGHEATVTSVQFGGDANHEILVSTCMDRTTRVWHLSSTECLAVLHEETAARCGIYAEGLLGAERPAIVTGSYGDAKIWRVPVVENDTAHAWARSDARHPLLVQVFAKTEGRVHAVRVAALFDRRTVVATASHDTVNLWAPVLDASGVRHPFTLEWLVAFAASGIVSDLALRPHAFLKPATCFTEPVVENPGDLTSDVTVTLLNASGLARMDSRKELEPYVVVRSIFSGDRKPREVGRTPPAAGCDPTWRAKTASFNIAVPVYKPCDVIFVIYDYDRTRGKHLACGQVIVLGADLLNEDAEPVVTRSLIAMGAKQVDVAGTLSFRVAIDDANAADIGVEVLCACANGSVDHALVFDLPRMPPPDPVIEVDETPVLEKARVLHDRRHGHHDELNLVYNDVISVLKKTKGGWWYGKRVVWNTRQDRSWFEEGWFPASYVAGDRWLQKQTGDHWQGDASDEWDIHVLTSSQDTSQTGDEETSSLGSYGARVVEQGITDILAKGCEDLFVGKTVAMEDDHRVIDDRKRDADARDARRAKRGGAPAPAPAPGGLPHIGARHLTAL